MPNWIWTLSWLMNFLMKTLFSLIMSHHDMVDVFLLLILVAKLFVLRQHTTYISEDRTYIAYTHQKITQISLSRFFIKNWALLVKERYFMFYLTYVATTFTHLSGSIWIARQKNEMSIEATPHTTHFLTLLLKWKCCSGRLFCAIDRNKW